MDFSRVRVRKLSKQTFLVAPIIYASFAWAFFFFPDPCLQKLEIVWSGPSQGFTTIHDALPPHPQTKYDSWLLGQLDSQLSLLEKGFNLGSNITTNQILTDAARLVNKDMVTAVQLHQIGEIVKQDDQEQGLIARVKGFFSFVNIMWIIGIFGIAISVGPVVVLLAGPVVVAIFQAVARVVIPILAQLTPLYEIIAYLLCAMLVMHGTRYPPETGFFISLTGCIGLIPSFLLTTALRSDGGGNKEVWGQLMNGFFALSWVPFAIIYQNSFLGFLTVVSVYSVLGFSVACYGLCYVIGFNRKDAMQRVAVSSVLLLSLFTGLKIFGISKTYFQPFGFGVMLLGNFTYFLALLIFASAWHRQSRYSYKKRQLLFITSVLVAFFFGSIFHLNIMTNTAMTFIVLFAMEKGTEIPGALEGVGFFVTILVGSILLYCCSLFLHTHPDWIVSLFNYSELF